MVVKLQLPSMLLSRRNLRPNFFMLSLSIFFFLCSFISTSHGSSLTSNALNAVDAVLVTQDDDYSCNKDKPCSNGACCGSGGYCGFGSTYCGDGCLSNCNATAPCGLNAATPGQGCPLNVCCSEYGFCGTTSEFCGTGCQSHCTQPKPSVSRTNVQKRIIGYWEAWNSEHPCGTMGPGEIPVNMLTHLNIAFGYITSDEYRITNMDGVSPDLYKIVGDLKQRNPDLKIMIALGGWAFSDPGTWQGVFPTMASTQSNRQTFIENLLGFLSEYGYDGVDFDWEYPGADDRGGSSADTDNFSQLLKELRAAIKASGQDYLVTFTSPTSYWYMRHFDIKTLTDNADWVNLMAYDIHGVWDSNDPVGNNVLAHTNLTEIDLALDLFWRNDVHPSKIVLGLAFYGRTFQLTDSSCWKPGCKFSAAGAKGSCTDTAGILSYEEINQILEDTGGTAYLDKEAAVRYMVYDSDNWVSFDDETTFNMKIEYANKMGLSGLMVWAIDLDDSSLDALSAVSAINGTDSDFDLVPLEYIFPPDLLPPNDTKPSYGLITIGNSDSLSPNDGGFGFLLVTGDSHAVSNLRKRDGEPEPFHFLDCPSNIESASESHIHTARVVCLSEDTAGCFQILERGVEGTLVEMPDNCAGNTLARAISLKPSTDQRLGSDIMKRNPTSRVYDFKFDYDMSLLRRDTDQKTSVRLDYATFGNYWDTFVNSPGEGDRDAEDLMKRYWSNKTSNWESLSTSQDFKWSDGSPIPINEDLSKLVWWQSDEKCEVADIDYVEAFGAYVDGSIDAQMHYGFSLYGQFQLNGDLDIASAYGFINAVGNSDLTYGISGYGKVDVTSANQGNPAYGGTKTFSLKGSKIKAGAKDFYVNFEPYVEATYEMASFNGENNDDSDALDSAANFDGRLAARVKQDFSNITAFWPANDPDGLKPPSGDFKDLDISFPASGDNANVLYYGGNNGGGISLGTMIHFGVKISMQHVTYLPPATKGGSGPTANIKHVDLGEMSLRYNTFAEFRFAESSTDSACSDIQVSSEAFQDQGESSLLTSSTWGEDITQLGNSSQESLNAACYPMFTLPAASNNKRDERSKSFPSDRFDNSSVIDASVLETPEIDNRDYSPTFPGLSGDWTYASMKVPSIWRVLPASTKDKFKSALDALWNPEPSQTCLELNETKGQLSCCGCVPMDWTYSYSDIPPYDDCDCCVGSSNMYMWPYGELRGKDVIYKRNTDDSALQDENLELDLEKRAEKRPRPGFPGLSDKKVRVCGERYYDRLDGRYPAFPKNTSWPWNGIEGGRYDGISRYWGNSSEFCSDWGVAAIDPADERAIPLIKGGGLTRADYETEHVFEGQTIGDFFNSWLDKGRIKKQSPAAVNPSQKFSCSLTNDYVTADDAHWNYNGHSSFIYRLLSELGSLGHMDRLTIFLARPNGMKGGLFNGNEAIAYARSASGYVKKSADAQLQSVKEMGMVFEYINNPKVWPKFCATFEAIYELMGEFDTYHAGQGHNLHSLQSEWPKYIRTVLNSISNRSKAAMLVYYAKRAERSNAYFEAIWKINMGVNFDKLAFDGTCEHLPMDP